MTSEFCERDLVYQNLLTHWSLLLKFDIVFGTQGSVLWPKIFSNPMKNSCSKFTGSFGLVLRVTQSLLELRRDQLVAGTPASA